MIGLEKKAARNSKEAEITYTVIKLQLYQVGNTSSCKNTEVKQLGPQLALVWLLIGFYDA